jgi:RNA polymerase sigma-70 factor (ECF subfamily)
MTMEPSLDTQLESYRAELRAHCRRILGSAFEADDAVQETMVRAWRNLHRLESRSSLRSWLYRIATNVCVDLLRNRRRRPEPVDMTTTGARPAAGVVSAIGGRPAPARVDAPEPHRVAPPPGSFDDPAEAAVAREDVQAAIATVVRLLPPRQRAALILREVLRWRADEIAELLGTTVPSVNSALQRARATLARQDLDPSELAEAPPWRRASRAEDDRALVVGCVTALRTADVDSLVSLLRQDVAA